MERTLLILATALTALLAGLYYAWSCSVMPGLARLNDGDFLRAMQAMDRAILNPVFFLSFLGAPVMVALCAWSETRAYGALNAWPVIIAIVLLWCGSMGVTALGNVPMNDALDVLDINAASAEELLQMRTRFATTWVQLNLVRTMTSIAALVLLLIQCTADHALRQASLEPLPQ